MFVAVPFVGCIVAVIGLGAVLGFISVVLAAQMILIALCLLAIGVCLCWAWSEITGRW